MSPKKCDPTPKNRCRFDVAGDIVGDIKKDVVATPKKMSPRHRKKCRLWVKLQALSIAYMKCPDVAFGTWRHTKPQSGRHKTPIPSFLRGKVVSPCVMRDECDGEKRHAHTRSPKLKITGAAKADRPMTDLHQALGLDDPNRMAAYRRTAELVPPIAAAAVDCLIGKAAAEATTEGEVLDLVRWK
jgi:hypothetical protein